MADDTEEDWAWLIRDVWAAPEKSALKWKQSLQESQYDAEFQERIKDYESGFRRGDEYALVNALRYCAMWCRPLPSWVAKKICRAHSQLRDGELRSWNDVFGKPFPGKRRKGILTRRKAVHVWHDVRELHEKESRRMDDSLFEDVGKRYRFSATTAKNPYYEYQDAIQQKVWMRVRELHEKEGRGLDDSLFQNVGQEFGLSEKTTKHLYKRLMQTKK
jgi:hypothetical protein